MEKETYWSKFADDFEERNNYVIGVSDLNIIMTRLAEQQELGDLLELGCGNGTYSRIMAPNATSIRATDYSDEMVEACKVRLKDIGNITVEKANCHDLTYAEGSFDSVSMANLLHIIPEPRNAIKECRRVLKPGGQIIIISYTAEGMSFCNKLGMIYRYIKTYGKPSPTAYTLTVSQACEMLEAEGFKVEEAQLMGRKCKAIFIRAIAV